jgi:pSer/pThr/pTyr-binding forkhead associated (FHA) protein
MARLLVQRGTPAAREINLQAGVNSLGRGPSKSIQLNDPSASGSHCQIVLENGNAVLKDLGSTNGTFVNRAPVKAAMIQPGQTIHLGGVEMIFCSDAPTLAGTAQPAAAPPGPPPP